MATLSKPEITRCFFDESVEPHLPAMELRWDVESPGLHESIWRLPDNLTIKGAPPTRFGVTLERRGPNSFRVRVLWNQMTIVCDRVSRHQVLASSLTPILASLGTDIWYLLEQPVAEAA